VKRHVKEEEAVKDLKLREYLMRNVVPTLSDGMIDVCKVAPIDPVDYLADYIFTKSNKLHKKTKS
jgi:adenylate kinase